MENAVRLTLENITLGLKIVMDCGISKIVMKEYEVIEIKEGPRGCKIAKLASLKGESNNQITLKPNGSAQAFLLS